MGKSAGRNLCFHQSPGCIRPHQGPGCHEGGMMIFISPALKKPWRMTAVLCTSTYLLLRESNHSPRDALNNVKLNWIVHDVMAVRDSLKRSWLQSPLKQLGEIAPSGRVVRLGRPGHGPTFSSERPCVGGFFASCDMVDLDMLKISEDGWKGKKDISELEESSYGLSNTSCFATKFKYVQVPCEAQTQSLKMVPAAVIHQTHVLCVSYPFLPGEKVPGCPWCERRGSVKVGFFRGHRWGMEISRSISDPIKYGYGVYNIHDITSSFST